MEKIEPTIIDELSQSLEIDLREKKSIEELKLALSVYINHLIINDLNKLMQILYRVDVSEKNIKNKSSKPGKRSGKHYCRNDC